MSQLSLPRKRRNAACISFTSQSRPPDGGGPDWPMMSGLHGVASPDLLPPLVRRQGCVELLDAEFAQRIHHAIGDAGRAADRAGFTTTLCSQRIGAAWRGRI